MDVVRRTVSLGRRHALKSLVVFLRHSVAVETLAVFCGSQIDRDGQSSCLMIASGLSELVQGRYLTVCHGLLLSLSSSAVI